MVSFDYLCTPPSLILLLPFPFRLQPLRCRKFVGLTVVSDETDVSLNGIKTCEPFGSFKNDIHSRNWRYTCKRRRYTSVAMDSNTPSLPIGSKVDAEEYSDWLNLRKLQWREQRCHTVAPPSNYNVEAWQGDVLHFTTAYLKDMLGPVSKEVQAALCLKTFEEKMKVR